MLHDYTPHQQRIIKRFYKHQDAILLQRLAELVTELYLAEGKKLERAWKTTAETMKKLGLSETRVQHVLNSKDPALVAEVVKELQAKP